jgi:cytochrome c oxidase cbb3-type subunit 3
MKTTTLALLLVGAALLAGKVIAGEPPTAPESAAPGNPYRGDAEAARQGATLFGAMNCDGCHGAGGFGFVGPSLIDGRWRFGGDEGELFRSIRDGHAQGMPAYGAMLTDTTIWQLVSYLQSLPLANDVPTLAWP